MLASTLTDEQHSIIAAVRDTTSNLMIDSLAGTGKTTMLELIAANSPQSPLLYLCFNRSGADEAEKRDFTKPTLIKTFNSLGDGIWRKAIGKNLRLNKKKTNDLLKSILAEMPSSVKREANWDAITAAVAMAKALGYVPEGKFPNAKRLIANRASFTRYLDEHPTPLDTDLIDATLTASIKEAYDGSIDFNDQIYMPALFGGTYPRFPHVLVDEYQDLNPTNHEMLRKLCRGRITGVGDPWQNIYGFRGAKQSGMAEATTQFKMTTHILSISFRCPRAIVELARWRVPHFKWIKDGGRTATILNPTSESILDGGTVLCRNNAPLFRLAFNLLSSGRSVNVAGSDIGPRLVGIFRRLGDESLPRSAVQSAIASWEESKILSGSTTAKDMADCLRVFAQHGATLGQAIAYVDHLFKQKGTIKLMTGHKAKGLEFENVYHLDPWLIGEDEQDLNLRYVIQTRSADTYTEINTRDFQW